MRPTDSSTSSTPARSTASRMNNVPNGPASLEDTLLDTLLVLAIDHRNVYMINVFIEAGASLDGGHDEDHHIHNEDELTPLMSAIDTGNVDVIKALIEAGASLEAACAEACAPLDYAIQNDGNVDVVNTLIEAGASLEAKFEDDLTPLEYAIHDGTIDVIYALIEAGASLEATGAEVCTPIEYGIKCDGNVDVINVFKDAERARSEEACLKAIFSKEYAMPDVELDFEPSHEGHPDLPFPPKAWISSASEECWRRVNLR